MDTIIDEVYIHARCCDEIWQAINEGVIDSNLDIAEASDSSFEPFNIFKENYGGVKKFYPIRHCPFCGTSISKTKRETPT
jgi:hypothetical protein